MPYEVVRPAEVARVPFAAANMCGQNGANAGGGDCCRCRLLWEPPEIGSRRSLLGRKAGAGCLGAINDCAQVMNYRGRGNGFPFKSRLFFAAQRGMIDQWRLVYKQVRREGGARVGFIPKDACWYLADVIIEDDPRNLVHVNTHLVEAESPEQAYEKALALGRSSEQEYANTDGKQVRVLFRGVRELNVIHDALEDGAELAYSETVGIPEEQLRGWITAKEQLGVFAPIEPKSGCPNYMPKSVMQMLEAKGFSREEVEGSAEPGTATDRPRD